MSVTVDDPVDVIRYILSINWKASNVIINSEITKEFIRSIYQNYIVSWSDLRALFVIVYGINRTTKRADLFYAFQHRVATIAIEIIAMERGIVVAGHKEVRRALNAARKIVNFSDGENHDATIQSAYDLIYLTTEDDQGKDDQGEFHIIQELDLIVRSEPIPT